MKYDVISADGHVDLIWPIWHVLDMTPGGRGSSPDFPALQYR